VSLWQESAGAAFLPLLPEGHELPDAAPDRLRAGLSHPGLAMLVADEDGVLAGLTACGASRDADTEPRVGEVMTLFVASGWWRRGVGGALMDAALADLAGRDFETATVWSFAENARANAFYEAAGFERDGARKSQAQWAGLVEVRYRRELP
jgi:ribosomal protein S18 acetylase RimI-like enzyme